MAYVDGGLVRPHVQAFADACAEATGARSFGTYPGHQPSIDLALDIFTPIGAPLGEAIAQFSIDNFERFGLDYVIYRQRIFNPKIANYWRTMADRGSTTANHFDHDHDSFLPTAPGSFPPPARPPEPEPDTGDDYGMRLIWNQRAVYAVEVGARSPWGLAPVAVNALVGSGLRIGGNPDDDQSNLFAQMRPTGPGLTGAVEDTSGWQIDAYDDDTVAQILHDSHLAR